MAKPQQADCHLFRSPVNISAPLEESGISQGGASILSQAQPAPKQLKLNKLRDADGLKNEDKPTPAETDSSGCFGIKLQ